MALLTPLALLGALAIGPIIVALYMLRLRREERTVSSTFLWQRMVRDVEANTPWQKLRRNWLLLLQLLLLALLVFALARPFVLTSGISGRNLVVIIDRSASMGATDVAPSRLEAAKTQAVALVDQLPDGGRATVIAAGGTMDVPAASTTDRRQLREAIGAVTLDSSGSSDLAQPLALAAALAAREADSEVAVISDGNVQVPADLKIPATVRYFPVGQGRANVAVSAAALQPGGVGQTLFVQLTNYGTEPQTRRVDIYLDDALFNAYNLTVTPGKDEPIVVDVPATARVAEARLAPDPNDGLPLDDRAWAVSSLGAATTVRVVGQGNRFLETALGLLPEVKLLLAPAATTTFTETAAQVPVTVLDAVLPPELPPGNLLFIAPPRSTAYFSVTGELEFPGLRPVSAEEPLLRNVSLGQVSVLKAARLTPGPGMRVVVDGDGGPLLLAGERDGRRVVVLAFDLTNSDLPLQVAFPLLVSNMVGYLVPGSGAEARQITPGAPLTIATDASVTTVRVTPPDGRAVSLSPAQGQVTFAATDALGVYTIEQLRDAEVLARQRYAANLFSPEESRIARRETLAVAQSSGVPQAITGERVGRTELWRWVAAAALLLLLLEWLVYQRSGLAALLQRRRTRRA